MGIGNRLRAKGTEIIFDTEDGEKRYLIKPLINEQLLEVQELWDKNDMKKANTLFVKYSLNKDPKIVNGTEPEFTDEEIAQLETPFLIQIMQTAAKVNGIDKIMDFQAGLGQKISQPVSKPNTFEDLAKSLPPAKKLT